MPVLEKPGEEWLAAFMEAQAKLAGEALFFTFAIGQLGVMGEFDKEGAREMIAVMRDDVKDMLHAADMLGRVMLNMLDNGERNLDNGELGSGRRDPH